MKKLYIVLIITAMIVFGGLRFYNSDWFITQNLAIKEHKKERIGKKLIWGYNTKYENDYLKVFLEIENMNKDVFKFYRENLPNVGIIKLVLVDDEGFEIAQVEIFPEEVMNYLNTDNINIIQTKIEISKKDIKKVKAINFFIRTDLNT